jgi:hypothetical protein
MSCGVSSVKKGTRPSVEVTFALADGTPDDPSAVTVITRDPSGDQVTYSTPHSSITNPSVGLWIFEFPTALNEVGKWWVRIAGTAGIQAATEVSVDVTGSHVQTP